MTATVAIVGDTLCGWLAAAALARRLPRARYRVLVIDGGSAGDGLGDFAPFVTVPPALAAFHADIGLDADALAGGFTLGTALASWREDGAAAFLPYGEIGAPLDGVAFHQLAGRLLAGGTPVRLADHALAAVAAQAGRFPASDTVPHALHLETARYTAQLRAAALSGGAAQASAPLADVTIGEGGMVTALTLADGAVVAPLLVLDCTGADARIAGRTGSTFEDWSHWLPCDRIVAEGIAADGAPPPYAQVEAVENGWIASWPLGGADLRLACHTGGDGRAFRQGARPRPWTGNCVALGAASCLLEPLHPTALTLLLAALARLIQLWPADADAPVEAAAFNRATTAQQARARDFLIGHYAAAGRRGGFWDARRAAALPDEVRAKRDLFAARGRVPMFDEEVFEEGDWTAMFDAMGLAPRRHDALADLLPVAAIERHLADHRARIIAAVRPMPPYAQVLAARHRGRAA